MVRDSTDFENANHAAMSVSFVLPEIAFVWRIGERSAAPRNSPGGVGYTQSNRRRQENTVIEKTVYMYCC